MAFPDSTLDTGNEIVVTSNPKGIFLEGTIYGDDILPGTAMQIRNAPEIGGRPVWEPYTRGGNGHRSLVAILMPFYLTGQALEQYGDVKVPLTNGGRIQLYAPIMGEECLVRVTAPGSGTGDSIDVGTLLMIQDATGLFIPSAAAPESEPFVVTKFVSDVEEAGTLVRAMYTGH